MRNEVLKLKLTKLGKGALIAATGAGIKYMAQGAQGIDFGEYTPAVVAVFAILVNAIRQAFRNTDDFDAGYECGLCDRHIKDGFDIEHVSRD